MPTGKIKPVKAWAFIVNPKVLDALKWLPPIHRTIFLNRAEALSIPTYDLMCKFGYELLQVEITIIKEKK